MAEIKWSGTNEADCIANYNQWFKDVDPNAKYYQKQDGTWVIEATAVKVSIPAVMVDDDKGKAVMMTTEEHSAWKADKLKEVIE